MTGIGIRLIPYHDGQLRAVTSLKVPRLVLLKSPSRKTCSAVMATEMEKGVIVSLRLSRTLTWLKCGR